MALLELDDVWVEFSHHRRTTAVVRGVSLELAAGLSLGLVGPSGCGKTTLVRAILGLERVHRGSIRFDGLDVLKARGEARKKIQRELQVVFQDPYSSLNPRRTIKDTVTEPLAVHNIGNTQHWWKRAQEVLSWVGLQADVLERYPSEFSGGQRQRIALARALILEPTLIICDEPTSALDVSIQAQIMNLLMDLRDRTGLGFLFISHNLALTRRFCSSVAVMQEGRIVQQGPASILSDAGLLHAK